jgi:hypothetical protein
LAFTGRTTRFAFVTGLAGTGSSNVGRDFGSTCCAISTAAVAACFTDDSTVLRVRFHMVFARVTEDSMRSPTKRMARDSTTVPSFTSVLNMPPASVCTQSRVMTVAPRLASHTWREAASAASPNWSGWKLALVCLSIMFPFVDWTRISRPFERSLII